MWPSSRSARRLGIGPIPISPEPRPETAGVVRQATTRTSHGACSSTRVATEPISMRATKFLPRRPMTMRSAPTERAMSRSLLGRIALARDDHDIADRAALGDDHPCVGDQARRVVTGLDERFCRRPAGEQLWLGGDDHDGAVLAGGLGSSRKRALRCGGAVVADHDGVLRTMRSLSRRGPCPERGTGRSARSRRRGRGAAARPYRGTRRATSRAGGERRRCEPVQPPRCRLDCGVPARLRPPAA